MSFCELSVHPLLPFFYWVIVLFDLSELFTYEGDELFREIKIANVSIISCSSFDFAFDSFYYVEKEFLIVIEFISLFIVAFRFCVRLERTYSLQHYMRILSWFLALWKSSWYKLCLQLSPSSGLC